MPLFVSFDGVTSLDKTRRLTHVSHIGKPSQPYGLLPFPMLGNHKEQHLYAQKMIGLCTENDRL